MEEEEEEDEDSDGEDEDEEGGRACVVESEAESNRQSQRAMRRNSGRLGVCIVSFRLSLVL